MVSGIGRSMVFERCALLACPHSYCRAKDGIGVEQSLHIETRRSSGRIALCVTVANHQDVQMFGRNCMPRCNRANQ